MHYDQDFLFACQGVAVKTLRDYGCDVYECPRPSWSVVTNFSMRVENPIHSSPGISNELYRIFGTIKVAALKAGIMLRGLPVYDVRICVREDPPNFERRIIIQVVHDPMPKTVELDDKATACSKRETHQLQSARLIRD